MRRNGGAQTVPVRSGRVGSGAGESLATLTTLLPQQAGTGRRSGARDVPARSGWECPRGVRIIPGALVVSSLLRAGTARSFGVRDVSARSSWECPRGVRIIPGGFVVSRVLRAETARAPGPGATSRVPA